jgi:DNA-binding HxlR family transcriptional regulator
VSRFGGGGAAVAEARAPEPARTAELIRESVGLLSSKWAVDLLLTLGHGPLRYRELLARLDPISEKVLTQTLRGMQRDGLVARRTPSGGVRAGAGYALTPLGASLAGPLRALAGWSLEHGEDVESARRRFDAPGPVRVVPAPGS